MTKTATPTTVAPACGHTQCKLVARPTAGAGLVLVRECRTKRSPSA